MRNATYELAIPTSPTSLSAARATASVVTSFASTAAATAISTLFTLRTLGPLFRTTEQNLQLVRFCLPANSTRSLAP